MSFDVSIANPSLEENDGWTEEGRKKSPITNQHPICDKREVTKRRAARRASIESCRAAENGRNVLPEDGSGVARMASSKVSWLWLVFDKVSGLLVPTSGAFAEAVTERL